MILPREFLLFVFLFYFSRCLLHNPSPPFIMEFFWVSRVPLFCSFANRACSVPVALVSPFAVFSHSFLFLVLIPSKVSGRPSFFWDVLRHALLGIPISGVVLSFLFGRSPVLPFLKVACCHSSSLSWFPETLSVCAMRGRLHFCFFVSCFSASVFFLSICPNLPFSLRLKGFVPINCP